MPLTEYPGYVPSNVSKDAKYTIRHGASGWEVQLPFRVSDREVFLLAHDGHPELVDMVNRVKADANGAEGGAFYINEFCDVIVPTQRGVYFAGMYDDLLEFDMEGSVVSPEPPASLRPGDPWPGPHVGVRYVLKAGGSDIKYVLTSGRRSVEHRLSDVAGPAAARALIERLVSVKGSSGGRIYINERCQFFGPAGDGSSGFVYLGALDDDPWFSPPDVPGRP